MIAMKFGGTSVQDAAAMLRVAGIVAGRLNRQPIVIISAIAQATNILERAGKLAADGKSGEARDGLLTLINRHYAILDALIKDRTRNLELRKIIAQSLSDLDELIRGVAILRELTPRTLDAFYCYGELLSSRLVSAVLNESAIPAVWIDTKDFLITDENYGGAMPIMSQVEERLQAIVNPIFSEGKIPVTQGFIGVTQGGVRTTMGRESSDYSSAIIGVALKVSEIQIWTDVDGVLSADPRVVHDPVQVKTLTFDEAFELSYFGAKVLHPNTMLPARERDIPIRILNSLRPEFEGTVVDSRSAHQSPQLRSVASKSPIAVVRIAPFKRQSQYSFWEQVYGALTKHRVAAIMTATADYVLSFAMDAKANLEPVLLDLGMIGKAHVIRDQAIVCIVGSQIGDAHDFVNHLFRSLHNLKISMISFGASQSSLSFVVDATQVDSAVRAVHAALFEQRENDRVQAPRSELQTHG